MIIMNRTLFLLLIFSFSLLTVFAQNDEKILLTIGDTQVSKAEFERIYKKNNSNLYNEADKKSPKEYLDLFINFKLKVIEAERLQMDTNFAFVNELAGYRKELAAPYLTDVKFNENMVREIHERMKKEVNASHILFRVQENASEEEEQAVLEKVEKVRQEILDGMDFKQAALKYSQDPSVKSNKGNLNYFTAFQMVTPFENAAFSTPIGEISKPVRSSFGYHLIQVHDLRKNRGEVKVAHIMKMFPKGISENGKNQLKEEIDSVYNLLKNGADFAEMARNFSDDKRSGQQGGEMPWFSSGRMIPEFAEPAFALEKAGDITKPVETQFGYHIIKKLDHRPVKSFEEARAEIENRIKKDPARSDSGKKAFIDKLKKEYNYTQQIQHIDKLKEMAVSEELEDTGMTLFTFDNKEFNLTQLDSFVQNKELTPGTYFDVFNDWVNEEITNLEDARLEEKYPDFRYLMREYHDGILLFNISEEKIWNFAMEDSTGLEQFYNQNKDKYYWEERFKGFMAVCKSVDIRNEAEKYFDAGMSVEEVEDLLNDSLEMIVIKEGAWEKGRQPVVDYFVWNGPEPEHFNQSVTFIRGNFIPPEPKSLDEARGLYISDYQNYLEKEWLKELRKKYKIKVKRRLLRKISNV